MYNQEEAIMKTINVVMSSAVALVGLFYLTSGQANCGNQSQQVKICQGLDESSCSSNSCCWWSNNACHPNIPI